MSLFVYLLILVKNIFDLKTLLISFDKVFEIDIISYLLGHSNVYWLTKGENVVYNILSKNRIYNLDWLYNSIGEQLETTQ